MAEKPRFLCRKRNLKYLKDVTWINIDRMPSYGSNAISIYACGNSLVSPGHKWKPRSMSYFSLEYICEGNLTFVTQEGNFLLKPGDLLILYPRKIYQELNHGPSPVKKRELLLNSSSLLSILCSHSELNGREVVHCSDPAVIEEYFKKFELLTSSPISQRTLLQEIPNTVFSLFTELIAQCRESNTSITFENQLKELDVFSPNLTLDHMADHFKVSKCTLNRMFMKQLHLTPFQYIIAMRMRYAVQLLRSNSLLVKDIAEECGYRNTSFFIAEFKKYFKMPPLQYLHSKEIASDKRSFLLDGHQRKPQKGPLRNKRKGDFSNDNKSLLPDGCNRKPEKKSAGKKKKSSNIPEKAPAK